MLLSIVAIGTNWFPDVILYSGATWGLDLWSLLAGIAAVPAFEAALYARDILPSAVGIGCVVASIAAAVSQNPEAQGPGGDFVALIATLAILYFGFKYVRASKVTAASS